MLKNGVFLRIIMKAEDDCRYTYFRTPTGKSQRHCSKMEDCNLRMKSILRVDGIKEQTGYLDTDSL